MGIRRPRFLDLFALLRIGIWDVQRSLWLLILLRQDLAEGWILASCPLNETFVFRHGFDNILVSQILFHILLLVYLHQLMLTQAIRTLLDTIIITVFLLISCRFQILLVRQEVMIRWSAQLSNLLVACLRHLGCFEGWWVFAVFNCWKSMA